MNGEPETNSYDFDIQDADVDVKTTAQSTGHSARRWVHLIGNENNKWDIYVFAQLTANYKDAAVIGWARNQDLTDKARTQGASESPFDYFPVRDMHSIIPQLSIAQPE